jgi:L-iditol 2-dehydrogenase
MSFGIQVKSASTKAGWGPQLSGFSRDPLIAKAVTLQGSFSHIRPVWERVVSMHASGKLQLDSTLSRVAHLSDWRSCFDAMHTGEIVKVVLRPC